MPEKTKKYTWTKFTPETIRVAREAFLAKIADDRLRHARWSRTVWLSQVEKWTFDSDDEFYAEYRKPTIDHGSIRIPGFAVDYWRFETPEASVQVALDSREAVQSVFEIFEAGTEAGRIEPPDPRVFIGHGRSADWMALRDFLRDRADYRVVTFESEPRAGKSAADVIDEMAHQAAAAVLVHTAEDETASGTVRARKNIVHETGFMQAHLGFERCIVLREQGTEDFSNLAGVQEIRYRSGDVASAFGEVQAALDGWFPVRQRTG